MHEWEHKVAKPSISDYTDLAHGDLYLEKREGSMKCFMAWTVESEKVADGLVKRHVWEWSKPNPTIAPGPYKCRQFSFDKRTLRWRRVESPLRTDGITPLRTVERSISLSRKHGSRVDDGNNAVEVKRAYGLRSRIVGRGMGSCSLITGAPELESISSLLVLLAQWNIMKGREKEGKK